MPPVGDAPGPSTDRRSTGAVDWLAVCRRAADGVAVALERYPSAAERSATTGRGEGGDLTLVIDRAAEEAVFEELYALERPLTVVSEERGEVPIAGGGPVTVVVDPIDGSLNAKRRLPGYSLSIAVASGGSMDAVDWGYVRDLSRGEEWWASRGEGAYLDGRRLATPDPDAELELLGLESARPRLVAGSAGAIADLPARRVRAVGSIALSLCWVAASRLDAMVSLRPCRSVDAAAAQLIVREAGAVVAFPAFQTNGAVTLDLGMRSPVMAAATPDLLERVRPLVTVAR